MTYLKFIYIILPVFFSLTSVRTFAQTLEKAELVRTLTPVLGQNNEIISRKTEFTINCTLSNVQIENETIIKDMANWKVTAHGKIIPLSQIIWVPLQIKINTVKLIGEFKDYEGLTVEFMNNAVVVTIDDQSFGKSRWGFGQSTSFDFNGQRLASKKSLFSFDYKFDAEILERYLMTPGGRFWFDKVSLNLISNGTIANKENVRNGVQNSFSCSLSPYYFMSGLIYRGEFSLSYQMETQQLINSDKFFNVINKHFKFGMEFEIPYTNFPFYKLHAKTGYARLAMPLTMEIEYFPKGEDGLGNTTFKRIDFRSRYEMAFSPYFIVQGEWHAVKFFNIPENVDKNAYYYSIAFAQDIGVSKQILDIVRLFTGDKFISEIPQGKHFIFYRISSGKRAPAFQDVKEHLLGFGTYF